MSDPQWAEVEKVAADFVAEDAPAHAVPAQAVWPSGDAQWRVTGASQMNADLARVLKGHQDRLAQALRRAKQPPELAAQLQTFVSHSLDAQMRVIEAHWQHVLAKSNIQIDFRATSTEFSFPFASTSQPWPEATAEATAEADDPMAGLSAVQLGQALGGLSDETVRLREKAGELFSLLRPGRKRGREYPAFQSWPAVVGEPLRQVLARLGGGTPVSGATAYGFFSATNPELGQLTAVEALTGSLTQTRTLAPEATALLAAPQAARLGAVLEAAGAYAADQAP